MSNLPGIAQVIPRRGHVCTMKGETLGNEKEVYSSLRMGEQGWERRDFCKACWEGGAKETFSAAPWSHWKVKLTPGPKQAELTSTRDERALRSFRGLLASDEEYQQNLAALLAIHLERRRQLVRLKPSEEFGTEIVLYEIVSTGEVIRVPVIVPPEDQVDQLQKDLAECIQ